MYTWEIEKLLKIKNYLLTGEEYLNMVKTSPQIKRIKYNDSDSTIEIWTKEIDKQEKYLKYKLKRKDMN